MKRNRKVILAIIGILVLYFISVLVSAVGLQITGKSVAASVIALELSTILSAPAMMLLFEVMPLGDVEEYSIAKKYSVIFMAGCMIMTSIVHFVQLSITMPLVKSGVSVSSYFQVGYWPSIPMAIDYLAWGLFCGTAFLCSSLAVKKTLGRLKYILLISALLCYTGLLGVVLLNENCWYIAPIGYGVGTLVVCIEILTLDKCKKNLLQE